MLRRFKLVLRLSSQSLAPSLGNGRCLRLQLGDLRLCEGGPLLPTAPEDVHHRIGQHPLWRGAALATIASSNVPFLEVVVLDSRENLVVFALNARAIRHPHRDGVPDRVGGEEREVARRNCLRRRSAYLCRTPADGCCYLLLICCSGARKGSSSVRRRRL